MSEQEWEVTGAFDRRLQASLQMGIFCCYRPERATTWSVQT